jgi:benzoyl-CoA reductase subunit BamB
LHEFGLDYVAEDFVKRGILTDSEDEPSEKTSVEKEKNLN